MDLSYVSNINTNTVLGIFAGCYVICYILKEVPSFKHNQYLPLISTTLGVIFAVFVSVTNKDLSLSNAVIDGLLASFAASGFHENKDKLPKFLGGTK